MRFDEILIGQGAEISHTITEADIKKFVELTGDDNRIHVDPAYAEKTTFKKPVAHGMLGASFISTIIGTKIPGDGALWYSQSLEFLLPVRVGDELTVRAEVLGKNKREQSIELKTEIENQNRQKVTTGIAKVKIVPQEDGNKETTENQPIEKTALILGASGGIGLATCQLLLDDGYRVFAHYNSNKTKLEEIKGTKPEAKLHFVQADLQDERALSEVMSSINRYTETVDCIVYASSFSVPNIDVDKLSWRDVQKQLDMHVRYPFEIIQNFSDKFSEHGGSVVLVTSQTVEQPFAKLCHYTVAKAAQHGLVKALAVDLSSKKIRVNAVSPGITDTNLNADLPEKIKLVTAAKTPLKRLSQPNDVAQAICFLANSEKSGFITGETIRVNGGQVMV